MEIGSIRYRKLGRRLEELQRAFLPFLGNPPASLISYSDLQMDATRAFLVLAHAELEQFIEDSASERVRLAKAAYDRSATVSPVLRRLIAHVTIKNKRSWEEILRPSAAIVDGALRSYKDAVLTPNHGLTRDNIERLLFPLGVLASQLDATLVAQLNSFGRDRGGVAHHSSQMQQPPDPLLLLRSVQTIFIGLLDLDRQLAKIS